MEMGNEEMKIPDPRLKNSGQYQIFLLLTNPERVPRSPPLDTDPVVLFEIWFLALSLPRKYEAPPPTKGEIFTKQQW